jgi:glutathione-regulated potassium-efflux system ancillary protein KefG
MPRRRILILFAHPALEKSRVNRVLIGAVSDVPGVTVHDLYEAYPDFHIDVEREQGLLVEHDAYVLHHPFFWYSTPAILKEWQDLVLQHGWAYGRQGTALRGKLMLNAITTGGRESAYGAEGYNRFSIRQLLAPIEQTAYLCGMEFLPPFVVHGTHAMTPDEIRSHASDYRRLLAALSDHRLDLDRARGLPRINLRLEDITVDPENT